MKQEEQLVVTHRPDGKKGITLTKKQYDILSVYILTLLDEQDDQTLHAILERAQLDLADSIDSDVAWFVLQVKLDLETRAYIRTIPSVYNKRIFLLTITRSGQRKLRTEKSLAELREG